MSNTEVDPREMRHLAAVADLHDKLDDAHAEIDRLATDIPVPAARVEPWRDHTRLVCISMHRDELAYVDEVVRAFRDAGVRMSRSKLLRLAVRELTVDGATISKLRNA